MKSFCRIVWLFAVLAPGVLLPSTTRADQEAVTNLSPGSVAGFVQAGVGFVFTPLTNLLVTRVGYEDRGAANPVIRVWSGTNGVLETYTLPPGANTREMIYSNVSLTLAAGQEYAITLQDLPADIVLASASFNFQTAALLTNYSSCQVSTNGVFSTFAPGLFYSGVNFSFQVQQLPLVLPTLTIQRADANSVLVSWPAPATGFVLQDSTNLGGGGWALVTNTVSVVNGTNQVTISPLVQNQFFRLFRP